VNLETMLCSAAAGGIAVLTMWGNVELWRLTHRRRPQKNTMSAFSDTIDRYTSRPLIHPNGLAAHIAPQNAPKINDC
jgi:hypothetical protein